MSVKFELDDRELIRKIRKAGPRAEKKVREIVVETLKDIMNDAKELCPYRTGNLRRSITTVYDDDYLGGYVTAYAPYAAHVEFGTSRQKAKPYLRPAFDTHVKEFKKKLSKLIEELEK